MREAVRNLNKVSPKVQEERLSYPVYRTEESTIACFVVVFFLFCLFNWPLEVMKNKQISRLCVEKKKTKVASARNSMRAIEYRNMKI